MAQLVEQRIRNAWVTSSSLVIGSMSMREGSLKECIVKKDIFLLPFVFSHTLSTYYAIVAQLVEHKLPKLGVAGSNPVCRSSR